MIRVDRTLTALPSALAEEGSTAAKERVKAADFFDKLRKSTAAGAAAAAKTATKKTAAKKAVAKKAAKKEDAEEKKEKKPKFEFSAYSDDSVKRALNLLFRGKCAYCESRYAQTQPMDVEHYRPKGRVDGAADHQGYHWLASDWDNLLPSCIDCNRMRSHEMLRIGGAGKGPNEVLVLGKGDRFPLAKGSPRAKAKGEEAGEQPLLLHPCKDAPESFLEFTDEGVVMPKARLPEVDKARAEESMLVYGLNRSELVQSRLEVLRLLQARFHCIRTLTRALDSGKLKGLLEELVEDLMGHEMAELEKFAEPDRAYSLMCRQVIERFKQEVC